VVEPFVVTEKCEHDHHRGPNKMVVEIAVENSPIIQLLNNVVHLLSQSSKTFFFLVNASLAGQAVAWSPRLAKVSAGALVPLSGTAASS
jgi:hypothetical protein